MLSIKCNCKKVGYDYKKYIHIINYIQYKNKLIKSSILKFDQNIVPIYIN